MAARENQRYVIAIIVMAVFLIGFLVATLLGWSKASEYADSRETASNALVLEKSLREAQETKANILATMIGAEGASIAELTTLQDSFTRIARNVEGGDKAKIDAVASSVNQIKEIYEKDMKSNSSAGGDDSLEATYKNLIANLNSVLAKKHNELIVKTRENEAYRITTDATIKEIKADRDAIAKNLTDTQKQLEVAIADSREKERELKDKMGQQQETLVKSQNEFERNREEAEQVRNTLVSKVAKVTQQNASLKTKVNEYEREVFDIPDGSIVRVNPSLKMVILNIGRADGLRVNRSFSVYDQTAKNFEKDRNKASIEITRLIGDKAAEARITDEDPNNPILANDIVLSPTWDPGYSTPIALAGVFDLNADGIDDREQLMSMIRRNGGNVVVYHDNQGNITGTIDASVRYLVLGDAPNEGPGANPEIIQAMKILADQADTNTVQIIDQRKLLNWMGVHGQARVERVGGAVEGFQSRSPEDTAGDR